MKPRVTVLIPNYNGARYLEHCFVGLIEQTCQDFICIFLDDGSSDNSVEIAKSFQTRLPQLEIREFENAGIAANWNRGLELAETEFFTLLHCDDAYEPDYLEQMLELMSESTAALGHCASQAIDESSRRLFSITELYKHSQYLPSPLCERSIEAEYLKLLEADFINCPSVIYRTAAVQRIGLFSAHLEQTLDWDYWFRTLRAGYGICSTNKKLYLYRRHGNNHTVKNSISLGRYREELDCLKEAHEKGAELGFAVGSLDVSGLRNILLVDMANALRAGRNDSAKAMLEFMQNDLRPSPLIIMPLRILLTTGVAGGLLMHLAIRTVVVLLATTNLLGLNYHKR